MSELTLLEKQSINNVSKIFNTYKISIEEAKKLTALSLDAGLFNGHIDLKDFYSIERLYIFKPFNKKTAISSGITSLDLSGNKDFKEIYFAANTVPNFNFMTLAHSNQIETFCADEDMHTLNIYKKEKKEAFYRNMNNRINAESDKKLKSLLETILKNHLHISKFNLPEDINYQDFLHSRLFKEFGQKQFA